MSKDKGYNSYTGDKDFDEVLDRVFRIMKTKAVDYGKKGDRLAQFRSAPNKFSISMRQVLGVYMDKHMSAIDSWIRGEELLGEPIEDKLLDNIVYSLLAYKIAKEERREQGKDVDPRKFVVKTNEENEVELHCDCVSSKLEDDTCGCGSSEGCSDCSSLGPVNHGLKHSSKEPVLRRRSRVKPIK